MGAYDEVPCTEPVRLKTQSGVTWFSAHKDIDATGPKVLMQSEQGQAFFRVGGVVD